MSFPIATAQDQSRKGVFLSIVSALAIAIECITVEESFDILLSTVAISHY